MRRVRKVSQPKQGQEVSMWGAPVVDSQGPADVKDIPAKGQPGLGGSDPQ